MKFTSVNSSSSTSDYYWAECLNHKDGPSAGLIILFSTYCFELLVGAPLNLWLICHIHKKRSAVAGVLPADFFPFHMALTQLAFFSVLPLFFVNHFLWQSTNMLNATTLLNSMVMIMKPLLHCLVCVERYMAVVRPINYLRFKGRQYRWRFLGAAWCIYIILGPIAMFKRSFVTACVVFLPTLVVDTFCTLSVLKALQKTPPGDIQMVEQANKQNVRTVKSGCRRVSTKYRKQVNNKEGEGGKDNKAVEIYGSEPRAKKEMNSVKRKAFTTIIIIHVVLMLNYLPFIITLFMSGLVSGYQLKCEYVALALAAAASCSYLHPVLYLHRLGRLCRVKKQLPVVKHLYH